MKGFFVIVMIAIFSSFVLAEVEINEVMYAPTSNYGGSFNEWIELYNPNNESINVSGCQIDGNDFDDTIMEEYSYLIVARDLNKFNGVYGNISAVDGGFVLSNGGDTIQLSGNNCSDTFNYTTYVDLADGNGKTLEKNKNGEWKESIVDGGTPGEKNSVYDYSYDFSVLKINEIMANPFGNDDELKPLGEWVEIYNSGNDPVYLEGLTLYDEYDTHKLAITDTNTLGGLSVCAGCYKVIYRDGDNDFELSGTTEDKVRLFYGNSQGTLFDEVDFAGAVEGMSWSKINGEWYKTVPSPGLENVYTAGCDWEVKVLPRESIFNLGQDIVFDVVVKRHYGEAEVLSVRGRVENIFGEVIKEYKPWTNTTITTIRTKTYTPNLQDEVYKIIFNITGLDCADNDLSNNVDFRLIVINPRYKFFDSLLSIEELYLGNDEEAEWGDQIRAKVSIYKGDETKQSVQLYVEKDGKQVSMRTRTHAFDKFTNYTLTLPVQLEPNCDNEYGDGDYELVLEGLEKEARMEFKIEGVDTELCQVIDGSSSGGGSKFGYKILESPSEVESGERFNVKVEVVGDASNHDLRVWSYVYRGPKHYGESDVEEIKLNVNEIGVVDLEIEMDEIKAGDYKLKVKINKDNQKTDKEITEEIKVVEEEYVVREEVVAKGNMSLSEKLNLLRELNEDGKIVYLASSEQSGKWLPILVMGVLLMLSLILIFKKV